MLTTEQGFREAIQQLDTLYGTILEGEDLTDIEERAIYLQMAPILNDLLQAGKGKNPETIYWYSRYQHEVKEFCLILGLGKNLSNLEAPPEYHLIYKVTDQSNYYRFLGFIRDDLPSEDNRKQRHYWCKCDKETLEFTFRGNLQEVDKFLEKKEVDKFLRENGHDKNQFKLELALPEKPTSSLGASAAASMSKVFSATSLTASVEGTSDFKTIPADKKKSNSILDSSKMSEDLDEKQQTQIKKHSPVNGSPPTKK